MEVLDTLLRSQPLIIAFGGFVSALTWWAVQAHLKQVLDRRLSGVPTQQSFDAMRDRLDAHGLRIGAIEAVLPHLPKAEQITELNMKLAAFSGELRAISEGIDGMERQLTPTVARISRIEDHLIAGGRA